MEEKSVSESVVINNTEEAFKYLRKYLEEIAQRQGHGEKTKCSLLRHVLHRTRKLEDDIPPNPRYVDRKRMKS